MKAIVVGIISSFVYSYGTWAFARSHGFNDDPFEAGVVKSIAYTLLIALPITTVAHSIVAFFRWRILSLIPVALGMSIIAVIVLSFFDSPKVQLMNILAFLGLPLAYSIPYALILNRKNRS